MRMTTGALGAEWGPVEPAWGLARRAAGVRAWWHKT